jgi:hypothetical protein
MIFVNHFVGYNSFLAGGNILQVRFVLLLPVTQVIQVFN